VQYVGLTARPFGTAPSQVWTFDLCRGRLLMREVTLAQMEIAFQRNYLRFEVMVKRGKEQGPSVLGKSDPVVRS
jgi:hypothetical protein